MSTIIPRFFDDFSISREDPTDLHCLPSSPQQLLRVLHSEQPRFNFCQIEVIFRDDMKVVDLLTQMVLWSLSHIVTSLRPWSLNGLCHVFSFLFLEQEPLHTSLKWTPSAKMRNRENAHRECRCHFYTSVSEIGVYPRK